MSISVLDCTLRDGGYCNNWTFGRDNISKIIDGLVEANIDIVECGYLTDKINYNENISKYTKLEQLSDFIPDSQSGKLFVAMMNYGEYDIETLPECKDAPLDGIRVAFHKRNRLEALEMCKKIKQKGYRIFVQGMVSLSYTDEEFIDFIHRVNELEPYAFYIVDSFGQMKKRDLIRLLYMVEHNLKESIYIGFHSHNNMQLAYSNAQSLVDSNTGRNLIIDSSVYGMGRGAGNLNTELFVEYLNDNAGGRYNLKPLLKIIDEILNDFHERNYWGYSLPNYLSAKHNIHPNYAGYLDSKKTLTVEAMDDIFSMIDDDKGYSYDKDYIENLYLKYMGAGEFNDSHLEAFKKIISGRNLLIIGPGKSSVDEKNVILEFISKNNPVVFSINFDYELHPADFIFVSNLRRFRDIDPPKWDRCICTSNIPSWDVYLRADYKALMNEQPMVRDNAGMMLICFLIKLGMKKVFIAGMDGYSVEPDRNFINDHMSFYAQKGTFEAMNEGMANVLRQYRDKIEMEFLTKPRYILV
jgi:4-hydroxy 2-oxovalerate aldolase